MIVARAEARKAPLYDHAGTAGTSRAADERIRAVRRPVTVAAPGHVLDYAWPAAAGATAAEVRTAVLTLGPDVAEEIVADAPMRADGNGWIIDVPKGKRVRAIGLSGFKEPGGSEITSATGNGPRLIVAFPRAEGGGFEVPRFAAPSVRAQNAIPRSLTGASFANGTMTLEPSVAAARVRIAWVDGATPGEFAERPTELAAVRLVTHTSAHNIKVVGPDGTTLWASADFDPDGSDATVDLAQPLSAAFTAALAAGEAPATHATVTADAPAEVTIAAGAAHGVLVRTVPGVTTVVVEGEAVPLPLTPPHAAAAPSRAIADLRLRYAGVRLVPDLSDLQFAPGAPVGTVVGAAGAVRVLPPQALSGERVARLAVRGRAVEAAELSLEIIDALDARPLGPPAMLKVGPGPFADIWASLPQPVAVDRAIAVRLRATSGRFLWANGPAGQPSLKIAVADPDPGGRAVKIGDHVLAAMTTPELAIKSASIAPAPFAGGAPVLSSELFVTVEFADLRLEYDR